MSNYNDELINNYNCPDCNEAKLQSDKNARKINEVIDQVNILIDINNSNNEATEGIVREIAEEKVNEVLGNLDIEEKIDEIVETVVNEELSDINTSLDNLESEINELKDGNVDIDLSEYATKEYVDDAINDAKLEGGDTQVDLSSYAKKSDLHSHSNKSVLDNITTSKVNQWNNKSDFSGSYNDLTNKPTIPTKTSQLTNDSGFITSIPNEYVTETELNTEINNLKASLGDSGGGSGYVADTSHIKGSVRVSNVFSNGQDLTGGYLSIIDDDNAKQVWEILKPMSEELNIPFCVAVPSNDIKIATGGSMTKEQLKSLQDDLNWEICGHTISHRGLGTLSYEEQLKEIRDNKALLTTYGLDVRGLCYPFGGYNNNTLEIMAQYFDYGFNGGQGDKYNTMDTFENYLICRHPFGSNESSTATGTLQYFKNKIDEVVANNGWLVLMTHISDKDHTTEDTENLKQLIQYAKEKNVTISTPNKIFDKFKNLIEIPGKLKITNNGVINEIANKEKVNIINDDTKVETDLLTSFKENTITYTKAYKNKAGNENLPDNGTLETVNIGTLKGTGSQIKDYTFRHQKLYGLNGEIWYRQPATYNNWTWGDWKKLLSSTPSSGGNTSGGSANIITETIVIPGDTIEPHTCKRFAVELVNKNKITLNSVVVVRPQGGIEDNIVYDIDMWGANSFGLKLYNIGNGGRNTAERTWTVKIIN